LLGKIRNHKNLHDQERKLFSFFLAFIMTRVPNFRENIEEMLGEAKKKEMMILASDPRSFEAMIEKFERDVEVYPYWLRLLLALDQFGNVLLWNGSHDETISGHIGRKVKEGRANKIDMTVCWFLRKIESRHCVRSIGE